MSDLAVAYPIHTVSCYVIDIHIYPRFGLPTRWLSLHVNSEFMSTVMIDVMSDLAVAYPIHTVSCYVIDIHIYPLMIDKLPGLVVAYPIHTVSCYVIDIHIYPLMIDVMSGLAVAYPIHTVSCYVIDIHIYPLYTYTFLEFMSTVMIDQLLRLAVAYPIHTTHIQGIDQDRGTYQHGRWQRDRSAVAKGPPTDTCGVAMMFLCLATGQSRIFFLVWSGNDNKRVYMETVTLCL
ncbi:hypothetical protein J6590_094913 [Homalodisca vitripennis]|nr:hypothetical protein J6590_094913 [Homalodisca vitripennis]